MTSGELAERGLSKRATAITATQYQVIGDNIRNGGKARWPMSPDSIMEGLRDLERFKGKFDKSQDYPNTGLLCAMEPNVPRALWEWESVRSGRGASNGIDYLLHINPGQTQGSFRLTDIVEFLRPLQDGEQVGQFRLRSEHVFPTGLGYRLPFLTEATMWELVGALAYAILKLIKDDE